MGQAIFEYSAGGVVLGGDRVLLVCTTDLKGEPVWTFPKGLLEKGEHSPQTALREVREETGYACDIICELPKSTYWFRRSGRPVHKTVRWFLMRPRQQIGAPDSDTATKVTLLVRSFGHATTETWVVTPWERFMNLAQGLRA